MSLMSASLSLGRWERSGARSPTTAWPAGEPVLSTVTRARIAPKSARRVGMITHRILFETFRPAPGLWIRWAQRGDGPR